MPSKVTGQVRLFAAPERFSSRTTYFLKILVVSLRATPIFPHWNRGRLVSPLQLARRETKRCPLTDPTPHDDLAETSCGYVTLLGAPNVGKSTLLNAFVGQDLSIVTSKAQTTWHRITGIRTTARCQAIFLDTPGILPPRGLLHRSLLFSAEEAVKEADVVVVICDPLQNTGNAERKQIEGILALGSGMRIGVVNKVDASDPGRIERERAWLDQLRVASAYLVSATHRTGLEPLVEELERNLPEGPFLYPGDEVATAPERFFVSEMVREAIFEQFREEVPYASICRVEDFRESGERTYIQVTIYVERSSQKGILIGDGGASIRSLGTIARKRIQRFLGCPVYLDLWVKVLPNWRRKPEQLRRLGIPVAHDDRAR
jgi:GTP-binding protein Era